MFEMLFYGTVIFGGALAYSVLKETAHKEPDDYIKPCEDIEKETYDYFCQLPLAEQKQYYEDNYDLRYYKNDITVGVTDDKHINAKHASMIARRTGKPFTNRFKRY